MSEGNGTAVLPPYIECPDCYGRGLVRVRVDNEDRLSAKDPSQITVWREHGRCNGGGILILREAQRRGRSPYYGAPKLS
jgi:hypothetical protein